MGTPAERGRRLWQLHWLVGQADGADKKKVIDEFCLKTFIHPRTAREYLRLLIAGGKITEKEGLLYANKTRTDGLEELGGDSQGDNQEGEGGFDDLDASPEANQEVD